ncbi:hypothetical protein H4S02_002015, partial [Coemansia sp. RSA 2611]
YAYRPPHTAAEQHPGPQTGGVSASASAARGYGALLNTHRHPHSTAQNHYMATSGAVPPPPVPQHYGVGSSGRRLSNAPSDPSDKVQAGPIRAGPANNHNHSSDDDTSEDEIESLRRAMGSDSRAAPRQLLRAEAARRQGSSDAPSSPATQDTALGAYHADISPPAPQQQHTYTSPGGMYAYPTTTLAAQGYSQAHYTHYPARQYRQAGGMASAYPAVATHPFVAGEGGSARHESASVRSNDQMSGTVTDASGYSQALWPQQAPLRAATDSPLERTQAAAGERMQRLGAAHVTEAGACPDAGRYPANDAAGPQPHAARLPYSYSANALAPMQEMQEMQGPPAAAASPGAASAAVAPAGPSPIAIQSLLNAADDGDDDERGSAAIRQHIANENARYRRQSGASGPAPAAQPPPAPKSPEQPEAQAPQLPRMASGSLANNDSSPNSLSSYHSAGYSAWPGARAETIVDYATAQQSFSSADDAPASTQRRASAYFTDAPVPAMPAPFAASRAADAMRAFEATVPPASSLGYGYFKHGASTPASVLVQVGDGPPDSERPLSESESLSEPERLLSESESLSQSSPSPDTSVAASTGGNSQAPGENPFASGSDRPARKATTESLDNVLEYYRTLPGQPDERPSPFDLPPHPNRRTAGPASSLVSLHRQPASPLPQRTSLSTPVHKRAADASPPHSPVASDASASRPHSPIAYDFARRTQLDARGARSQLPRIRDVYAMLDDLSEPEDLELPPASTAVHQPAAAARQRAYPDIPSDSDSDAGVGVLQMEAIDRLDELSDIIDLSTTQDSDFAYSHSDNSTDSFGEPIEHEAGMLSKSLLDAVPATLRDSSCHDHVDAARLPDDLGRAANARPRSGSSQPPHERPAALLSGRTNASTLTTSSTGNHEQQQQQQQQSQPSLTQAAQQQAAPGGHAAGAARDKHPPNDMPLEIMEHASELELALAREQEDYYTDNDPTQPTLDPSILQNLGRAVHHQCQLQRQQQLQRRKSNMQLGLPAAGSSEDAPDVTLVEPLYADHEQALRAMLTEVSQYFTQSGLSLVFPFSAKWVGWLTRHPDRPFPWRKDPDEEDLDRADDDSDASSFGGDPPVLSRPLPPDDVLSVAMIPMSKRRPARVTDFVTQEKRKGINAHWQYYSVINQITTVASTIHRRLAEPGADHGPVAHELAALYQFLGGDFKKYKERIEKLFDAVKLSLGVHTPAPSAKAPAVPPAAQRVLAATHVDALKEIMASIIIDALYSMNRVAAVKEHPPPNTPTGRARQEHAAREPFSYAISTLKGLPTQPIVRYLTREMRVANGDRRRRGLAHTLSRNNSVGHLRHPQYMYQVAPPVPPLPLPSESKPSSKHSVDRPAVDSAVAAMLRPAVDSE